MDSFQEELKKLGGTLRGLRAEETNVFSAELAQEMGISLNDLARIELSGPENIDELLLWLRAMTSSLEKKNGPPPWWTKIPVVPRIVYWIKDFLTEDR